MLEAQVRVVEAEKMNSQTALDSTRDQLRSVTEQHSRACQHITELQVGCSISQSIKTLIQVDKPQGDGVK